MNIKSKLIAAGINMDHVRVQAGEVEIFVEDADYPGTANRAAVDAILGKIRPVLQWPGGFYSGYESFFYQKDAQDSGDWNDVSSSHHY